MKAAVFCPDCKTEYVIDDYHPPTYCGLCNIKWRRQVVLVEDTAVGDVSAETPTEAHVDLTDRKLWTP